MKDVKQATFRVRMSKEGLMTFGQRNRGRFGTAWWCRGSDGLLRVKWDGRKTADTLHTSFLDRIKS